jgi:UDP-glucose 4-epimerase/UDP-glucuronate decarboxylase
MGEFLCLHFGIMNKIPASVIRYHNIYGPRMGTRHVIPEFILRARQRETPFAIFGGDETRAFCHVDDAVRATREIAIKAETAQEIIHVGNSKEEITIRRLAELILSTMDIQVPIQECGRRLGSVSRRCPDTSKLRQLTGFEAAITLAQGLRGTIEWYLAQP